MEYKYWNQLDYPDIPYGEGDTVADSGVFAVDNNDIRPVFATKTGQFLYKIVHTLCGHYVTNAENSHLYLLLMRTVRL